MHLQAYQNEALIWRTKAAQLEIIIKQRLTDAPITNQKDADQLELLRAECDQLKRYIRQLETRREKEMRNDSGIDAVQHDMPGSPLGAVGECVLPQCVERKKLLIAENNTLIEQVGRIHSLP